MASSIALHLYALHYNANVVMSHATFQFSLSKWHPNEPKSFHHLKKKSKVLHKICIIINDPFHVDLLVITLHQPIERLKFVTFKGQAIVEQ